MVEAYVYFSILVLICSILVIAWRNGKKEGFYDVSTYEGLQRRLKTTLDSYCKLSAFTNQQVKHMYLTTLSNTIHEETNIKEDQINKTCTKLKTTSLTTRPESEAESEANKQTMDTYNSVYSCTDELADSRPTCGISKILRTGNRTGMKYVSCDVYMNLPPWSDDDQAPISIALSKITDDLPERITREVDWFAAIIRKLGEGFDQGNNPTYCPAPPKTEGFVSRCSPASIQERLAMERRKKLEQDAVSCSIPSVDSEIQRINTILDSQVLKAAVDKCDALMNSMLKLQSNLQRAKDGNLYEWQKDGPKKTYMEFKGGDRTAAFTYSLQQNT